MAVKFAGRPPGAANKATKHLRNEKVAFGCSEGFSQALTILATKQDKSKADVIHDALREYAFRSGYTKDLKNWIDKI